MNFASFSLYCIVFVSTFVKFSFPCGDSLDHSSDVVSVLNVTVKSVGTNDGGEKLAYIWVNNKNYAPQTKGYNVAAFDVLSGRFLTSSAFDCAAKQDECDRLGEFLRGLPQDVVVLMAIQISAVASTTLPVSDMNDVGAQSAGSVQAHNSHAVIGYKGKKSVSWTKAVSKGDSVGPTEISSSIPINCSYLSEDSTTCTTFNVASKNYGGSCLNQSSSSGNSKGCENVLDGDTTAGWESASNEAINSFIQIGFHTIFIIDKLRIMPKTSSGQQIQEIWLEFSDCSLETITLAGNTSDFEEFTFLARRTSWVKFTIKKVLGNSGGVGIKEIELYNDMCKQKTICDLTQLSSGGQSERYRLHRTQFPLMIDAKDDVSVLLTSDSREQSSGYSILIGSNGKVVLKRQGSQSETLMEFNATVSLLKENEMRLFWIDAAKDRLIFGSGEKVYLFWREAQPVKIKYAFLSATSSSAKFQICARVDHCYKDASHYWPLDKSTIYQQDLNDGGSLMGKIRGSWSLQVGPSDQGFTPLSLSLTGSNWVGFGFKESGKESCVNSPSQCLNGISVSFKTSISGNGTGYILSSGGQSSNGFSIYYVDSVMHFNLRDGQKIWKVQVSFEKNKWQTFAMSWSQQNGLTAMVYKDSASVLRDPIGKIVTPSSNHHALLTIGRTGDKGDAYAKALIRDVAVWKEEITQKKMSNLHVCNDRAGCASGWSYFDGSCYKVLSESLAFKPARNSCLSQGADLVKISSEEENAFVKNKTGGEAWIGLQQTDSTFYWKDGSGLSFNKSISGSSGNCVVMEVEGTWRKSNCSLTPGKYTCEQVVRHHLGCYEDNAVSPSFIFNPGGYKPSSMTPGLCMHSCGALDFTYAALKNGNLCLCANSTSTITERSPDMCLSSCLGTGNLKCGGETHISVYKTVQVQPLSLTLTLDLPITTLTGFNLTMTPSLPEDQIVEYYVINVGDGTEYFTTDSVATLALIESGNYTIQGKAIAKHSDTGHRTVVESSTTVSATSNVSGVEFFCPSVGSVNMTFSCSLKFKQGANVETTIQFEDGVDRNTVVPDAEILTLGIYESDPESQVTSDGLYLLAGMDVTNKGEVVGLEMDVEQGGFLDLKIYRPTCEDQKQLYCQAKRVCVTRTVNSTSCPVGKTDTCNGENVFSFKRRQCATESCSENNTIDGASVNFDYKHVSSYMVYLTSGHKLFLIESTNQRLQVEEGDVIGVRFPSTGPAAALKTSPNSFSFLYNISDINGTTTLRSNRLPLTDDSPTELHYAPAIAILYSAVSETKFEHQYQMAGHETVSFSVGNSRGTESFTRVVALQEAITDFQLKLPDAFPYGETFNVTAEIVHGTNVTYFWEFGDGENATTSSSWVTHVYKKTGSVTLNIMAINKVSLVSIWCTTVAQERIAGLEFRETALLPIENGTTANIGWLLRNGSHVNFNITITSTGDNRATNLTNPKVPGAIFFAIYKTNLTIPGLYLVSIIATNKVNNLTISGNLSVQRAVHGVQMTHPGILRTNQTFNFTILPHQGEEWARYTLLAMDGTTINTSDKVIPHVYRKAGRYKVSLIASNDISSVVVRCAELIVQDIIEGLEFRSFRREVGVMEEARVHWKLNQGSEISILVDYGDGESKAFEKNISVGDIFVAISLHNYSAPGEYLVNITVSNLVDSQWINATVYVETPVTHLVLAVQRGSLQISECGRSKDLYIAVNDSVTVTADIHNGTNVNVLFDFGEGTSKTMYHQREFPINGTTANHTYSIEGAYYITVKLFNRNQDNHTDACRVIVQYPIDVVLLTSNSPQPSNPGKVHFFFHFPGYNASAPLKVKYDFGDNETQRLETLQSHDVNGKVYQYPGQGVYTATVNMCNEISCGNSSVEVRIQDKIHGLRLFSHLTNFINTCSKSFTPDEATFPKEYDVFFNSSITNGTNVTYSWRFPPDDVELRGMSCRRKFNSTGNHEIVLTAKNDVSNKTVKRNITVHESILRVKLRNDGPAEMGKRINFTLSMEQKGNDSCFDIDLKDNTKLHYKTGEGKNCVGSAKNFKNSSSFDHIYKEAKPYWVSFKGKNRVSCVTIEKDEETKAAIVKGECIFPKITAPGIGVSEKSRTKFNKSEKIEIKTVNTLKCYNFSTEYYWNMTKSPDSAGQLEGIRFNRPDLIIPPRKLDYGLYELQFSINMLAEPGVYTMEKFYIEIAKTDLVALIDGGTERTVGNEDPLTLNADKSHDPDTTEAGNTLNVERCSCTFAWFCKREKEDVDINYELPVNLTKLPPIPTLPVQNITANDSGGCFGYGPGRLNLSNVQAVLNTTKMRANTTYIIRFIITKDTRHSYADQKIQVKPGSPPTLSIECRECHKKINPSSKLTLEGIGKSKGGQKIFYRWKLEKEKNDKSWEDVPLKERISTPLTSNLLVIKPDTFEGGSDYKITLYGNIPGGETGSSTLVITVNAPPRIGNCEASPFSGEPLDPTFTLKCEGFTDVDTPLSYEFFYSTSPDGQNNSLGSGLEDSREKVPFPNGLEQHQYKLYLYAKVTDNLGASTTVAFKNKVEVKKIKISVTALQKKATEQLDSMINSGNVRETASFVLSVAEVLNDPSPSSDDKPPSEDDKKKSKELREKLAIAVVESAEVSDDTSLSDVAQFANTLTAVTNKPEQNTDKVVEKVSNLYDHASKAILAQATGGDGASSREIEEASTAVFGGAVNIIRSADVKQKDETSAEKGQPKDNTQIDKVLDTLSTLSEALIASKVSGEDATKIETQDMSMGVSKEDTETLGEKPVTIGNSQVKLPQNSTVFGNGTLDQVAMLSAINLYPGGPGSKQLNNSQLVSFTLYQSGANNSRKEFVVKDVEPGKEISVMVPRQQRDAERRLTQSKLHSSKFNLHKFVILDNSSAVTIEAKPEIPVDVEVYVKVGGEPKPSQGEFNFNSTLSAGRTNSSNSSIPSYSYEYLLSNDILNWTAAGSYSVKVRYKLPENLSFTEDQLGDGVGYNFSVYTSSCLYHDQKDGVWRTDGVKVGPKSSFTHTECLTTHLTTFGSNFFVAPNAIDFKNLSTKQLLDSPHALIAVCTILGLYLLCLIPARKADKNDALKTGVTPLPDNDSRDTYCYEIQVHTGFVRGAGSSAEVSIVITGALGDSEPRVMKDPKRKTFKTGAVDAFLLTVPQSLGNLKQIRVWHNNGGTYPSWNLLRIMIQDIQTDQRWWFVCDDWLAVEEGDGKIEKTLFPASKKELTKFNVLFTSEVRKNLTDGHIWFSVVARPPRSTFTRVQRLTCCLSILLCTMVSNAMYYEVGKYETPKNAINIMGFSFSIRSVSVGIVSSIVVFPINLVIVTLFRKAKPKENRYSVKTEGEEIDDVDIEMGGERKKVAQKKGLPHWFVYVAYGIAFLAVVTSGSFVVMYGMQFGPEKSAAWLSSMTISFLQDVLLNQPVKVFALATLFALLIKDPKKAEEESYAEVNALANDEEWLHKNTEDLDDETQKALKNLIIDKPPDEAKLEIARQLRMKEKQMKSIIQEIAWYLIFLLVLLTISYGNRDLKTSQVTRYMQNIFEKASYSGNVTYDKVHDITQYWQWLNETFIPSLNPEFFYNNLTQYEDGYLADTPNAWLLGVARLRQLRIKKDTCTYKEAFHHLISECNDFYSMELEDQGSYLPEWKGKPLIPQNSSLPTPIPSQSQEPPVPGPWVYQSGTELKTFPYWGYKATYSAGGYVQTLPKDINESLTITGKLSLSKWLDRYTRAIFSEFAIYNANTNLFCVVTLLFEQLPTGSLTPYPSILTLRLFRYVGGEMFFVLTCEIVYLLFCAYFVVKEIKMFVKKGREHLKNPWSILEILVTLLSLSAVGLYFARLKFTKDAIRDMNTDRAGFVSFHYTAFLDEWFKCIMGLIVFFSFLKVFRLLRFNRRISLLQQVLKRSFFELLSFMFMFALAFLAFALLACLVFGQAMEGFGTFLRSCASLMDTILGKFTLKELSTANRILGPIFFYTYTVTMVFVLINMFLSIINDAFAEVRSDVEKQSNEYEIVDFMVHRLKENIGKSIGHAIHPVYKEPKSELELNFDRIADDADNAMHFMRNIAFEDMRKTRWFQSENCTEKKKNLMRLLMEVDWDYYEEELCDSIPVFEKFLNQYSDEEVESVLQYYQQKRMVEDLVFDQVNGSGEEDDSSDESNSDSDDSNDDSDEIVSDDEELSNDEKGSEAEDDLDNEMNLLAQEIDVRLGSSGSHYGSVMVNLGTEMEPNRIRSPSFLMTDTEPTATENLTQNAPSVDQRSIYSDSQAEVTENELVKILQDVRRDAESRCATDAEIESIFGDSLSAYGVQPLKFDSEPEDTGSKKKNVKKRRKKKDDKEMPKEKTTKDAWVVTTDENAEENTSTCEPQEHKVEKRKEKKGKKKEKMEELERPLTAHAPWTGDEADEELLKPKKKGAKKGGAVHEGEEETAEPKIKKKKAKEFAAEDATGGNIEEETIEDKGKKDKKKNKKKKQEEADDAAQIDPGIDEKLQNKTKKKKKKRVNQLTVDDDDGRSSARSKDTEETIVEEKSLKKKTGKKTKSTSKEIGSQEESEC